MSIRAPYAMLRLLLCLPLALAAVVARDLGRDWRRAR